MRRAFSLVELLTALVLSGLVLALVVRASVFHERFQRADAAARGGLRAARQAAAIVGAALQSAAPGDLEPAGITDTSVEFLALVASGAGCLAGPALTAGAGSEAGPALAAFATAPRPGDSVLVFDDSRTPPRWTATRVQRVDAGGVRCPMLALGGLQTIGLDAAVDAGPVAAFRVLRRARFSLYRSGDGSWYLGMRDWNLAGGGFAAIQPVAGPLAPFDRDPARSGLRFAFIDSAGRPVPLPPPGAPAAGVRLLRITVRAPGGDSAVRVIGLPHGR